MYYTELLQICKDGKQILSDELIDQIDTWLYMLPDSLCDKITASKFSKRFGLDYELARAILEKLSDLEVLKRIFAIHCPICEHLIKLSDEDNLVKDMYSIEFCYRCNSEEIEIESGNIEVRYKLVKKHYDPEKTKDLCRDILGGEGKSSRDTIEGIIKNSNYNVNNLFYKPTVEQQEKLKELYCGVGIVHSSKTSKGNSLEDLVKYLLNSVKPFEANGAWTDINQIDCLARNKFPFNNTVLNEVGSIFYCECKNEKKQPGNSYFHKIHSIMQLSQNGTKDRRFGIVFSIRKPAATAHKIAMKAFNYNNILSISFCLDELEKIIYENVSFLDEIERKINVIKYSIVSDLKELGLY